MIKLREVRKARGMTQAELAKAVQFADPTADQATISVLERGELYPSEKLRDALCAALHCTEDDLYDGVEAMFVPGAEREVSDTTKILEAIFAQCSKYIPRYALREEIKNWTGEKISDRTMREWIERARQEGLIIANDQDGYGYYIPRTKEELQALHKRNQNRAMAILMQQPHIKRRLKEWESQSPD